MSESIGGNMEKVKGFLEGVLYLTVIFLSQRIINDLFGSLVFYLVAKDESFVSKMFFSRTLTIDEKALTIIDYAQPFVIMIAWVIGIGILMITLKASHQDILPSFRAPINFLNILLSVIIGLGMVLITNGLIYGIIRNIFNISMKVENNNYGSQIFNVMIIVAIIPFFEEVLFRGYIMGRLHKIGSIGFAIVIQSALFSISHLDVFQGFSVFLLSISAGYAVIKTNSLLSGMIIHGVFNLTNIYLYQANTSFFGLDQMFIFIVIGLLLSYFGLYRLRETTRANT